MATTPLPPFAAARLLHPAVATICRVHTLSLCDHLVPNMPADTSDTTVDRPQPIRHRQRQNKTNAIGARPKVRRDDPSAL
eukprot:4562461-Prymnesium_polylepis.1